MQLLAGRVFMVMKKPLVSGYSTKAFEQTVSCRFQNGTKASLLFSPEEYSRRVTKLREVMAAQNVQACVFTSIQNVAYYSNFVYCSFGRPFACVVTQTDHVTLSPLIDGGQPWRRSWKDNLIYTDWQRDNFYRALKQILGPYSKGSIGLEFDHVSVQGLDKMKTMCLTPSASVKDISAHTMAIRMIKSQEEIQVHKQAARAADLAGFAIRDALEEGVTEYELADIGTKAMNREVARTFGDKVELRDTWVWFQSGINTDGAHNALTNRSLRSGDILSLNCFPMVQGYYTALERTMFLDKATDEQIKIWEANVKVHRRGLQLIRPGARCCDIARELNELFLEEDLLKYRSFGYGHSFGVLSHYYGREAGLELREDIETVLQPGMIVSMEPMLTIPEGQPAAGGYREHDIVVIHHDGSVENITHFPIGPEHNIVRSK